MTEGSLISVEGICCMQIIERIKEVVLELLFTSVQIYASPKCSLYSLYEHTVYTCSTRYLATES